MNEFTDCMGKTWIIAKRELGAYFNSPIAYIFLTVFLLLTGWLFYTSFFVMGQASMRSFFSLLPWVFLILVPAITMRMWSEEKKQGTLEVLLTLPFRDYEVVLGKFLASFLFLGFALFLTLLTPLLISFIGDLDWGVTMASYLGSLLLGSAYVAIGLWVSSTTSNQIVAFILSVVFVFSLFIIGQSFVLFTVPSFLASFFSFLSLSTHFESIARGVIDSRDVLYYFSMIGFFLYLNVLRVISRR